MKSDFSILLARHPAVRIPPGTCYGRLDLPMVSGWETCVTRWQEIWRDIGSDPAQDGRGEGVGKHVVFHSPASRCLLPAKMLMARGKGQCQSDLRLTELDFGLWEGQLWSAVSRRALDEWAADPLGYRLGGAETVNDLVARVTAFWHERMAAAASCCVITHGGPLRVMLALAEKRPFRMEDPAPGQGQALLLHFSNNSTGFILQKLLIY